MKKGIHPDYHHVVFRDKSADYMFLTRSTATSDESVMWDGVEYPVIDVDVSHMSHPFWTGKANVLDVEGRVAAFERRYGSADPAVNKSDVAPEKEPTPEATVDLGDAVDSGEARVSRGAAVPGHVPASGGAVAPGDVPAPGVAGTLDSSRRAVK